VSGGDTLYLCHWMRQAGLADLLPSLRDSTLGVVDFSIFPRLDDEIRAWTMRCCRRSLLPTRKPVPGTRSRLLSHTAYNQVRCYDSFRLDLSG
jgi:hypothetical protein